MDAALWIVAGLLAVAFGAAGVMKVLRPKATLAASGLTWVEDFSEGTVTTIGVLEVAAAVGLVLPPLLDVAPVLAPLAACGLVALMIGAAVTHIRRGELPMVGVNAALGVLAAFVAWGRFGPNPFG